MVVYHYGERILLGSGKVYVDAMNERGGTTNIVVQENGAKMVSCILVAMGENRDYAGRIDRYGGSH